MAEGDLQFLRDHLPDVFEDQTVPPGWSEDWVWTPANGIEGNLSDLTDAFGSADELLGQFVNSVTVAPISVVPQIDASVVFPGAPQWDRGASRYPPPDAYAFYLPFHYFYPTWWGIYVSVEGLAELNEILRELTDYKLDAAEGFLLARTFLYRHEAFHHQVEAFATRLEVTHRTPLYREGFERLYRRTLGTDDCMEEGLASAYALISVYKTISRWGARKKKLVRKAFEEYIRNSPPGYRMAVELAELYETNRSAFAEQLHQEALPKLPRGIPGLWSCFPYAFSGIARVTSRTNYIVRRDSPLAHRVRSRFIRPRELHKRLRVLAKCERLRSGRGSHEIWRSPSGASFPIPSHPRDLATGTLAKIIRQAGLNMSVSKFLESKV